MGVADLDFGVLVLLGIVLIQVPPANAGRPEDPAPPGFRVVSPIRLKVVWMETGSFCDSCQHLRTNFILIVKAELIVGPI